MMKSFFRSDRRVAKTPTVIQMEQVECGAAALCMILGFYNKFISLEELRQTCSVSRDGVSAAKIVNAARHYGMQARGFKLSLKKLEQQTFPVIVFWDFRHFLVVEGFDGDTVLLNDPALGPRRISRNEFDMGFTGVTLLIEPGENFYESGKAKSLWKSLWRRLETSRSDLSLLFLLGLFLVVPGIVVPAFTKIFIDEILISGFSDRLRPLIGAMLFTAILMGGLLFYKEVCLTRLKNRISLRESARFFIHLIHLPQAFFSQRSAGDLAGRVTLNDSVANSLTEDMISSSVDMLSVFFLGLLMIFYDWRLAVGSFLMAGFSIFYLQWVNTHQRNLAIRNQSDLGKLAGTVASGLMAMPSIKAGGRENEFFSKWLGYAVIVSNSRVRLGFISLLLSSVSSLMASLNTVFIVGAGGYLVIQGDLTIGELAGFQALALLFLAPVTNLVGIQPRLQVLESQARRIDDIFEFETNDTPELKAPRSKNSIGASKLRGHLTVKNLTFGYDRLGEPLIRDFSLDLPPGKQVAIVGPSGSGKSTLAKLILGLYTPWSGIILLDGCNIGDYSNHEIFGSVSLVDQASVTFTGTVKENITLWNDLISPSAYVAAANDAEIHHVIAARPAAYESLVESSGSNFSGGELQRLEIARSLASNPRLLIMDEATSALDATTERNITRNICRRGCASLIIAHRLSTVREADEIIVLENGNIVQRGNHQELMADNSGLYIQLVGNQ